MPTDPESVEDLVRQTYQSAENAPWELAPEDIRARRRRRVLAMSDPKAIALVTAAAVLIVVGFFALRPASHTSIVAVTPPTSTTSAPGRVVVVPTVVGLTQAQAGVDIANAGLKVGVITEVPSTRIAADVVVSSVPVGGSSLAVGGTVSLAVSTGPPGGGGSSNTAPPSTTGPSRTSTTPSPPSQITADLTRQTIAQGLAPSSFVVSPTISTADSAWAEFGVKPSASVAPDTFQPYSGFAHLENGSWIITIYGTAGLNCSALPGQPSVPSAVLQEFGWTPNSNCPGSSS